MRAQPADMATTLRQLAAFYLLAVAISWALWTPLWLGEAGLGWLPIAAPMPWVAVGTAGPLIAAFLVEWKIAGHFGRLAPFGKPLTRWLGGTVAGVAVVGCTFVFGTSLLLTQGPPDGWNFAAFGLYGFHIVSTFIGGPLLEEWGWRGFAQSRLQEACGALPAALIVGAGWALWHLPLFLVPAWSSASPFSYFVMVVSLSVVMAWGYNLAGGSIVTAIAMHATYNSSSRVLGEFLGGASLRDWPEPVTAILLAFLVVAVVLAAATRGRLARR